LARGSLLYLVCTFWEYTDIRRLALHRVRWAVITDLPATRPAAFDLDTYIASGAFQYAVGDNIQLVAVFERGAAAHLYETPLSADQVIEAVSADRVRVRATVRDTAQLEWWLLGFADLVVVSVPETLRDRLSSVAARMSDNYRQHFVTGAEA
jgi:predicted DNA-binding transcriptional regulator YafY